MSKAKKVAGVPFYSPRYKLAFSAVHPSYDILHNVVDYGVVLDNVLDMADAVSTSNGITVAAAIEQVCRDEEWDVLPEDKAMIQRELEGPCEAMRTLPEPTATPANLPAIRFIVTTLSSSCDTNGNTYHFARVRSTLTGKQIAFDSGSRSNAQGYVMRATGCSVDAVHSEEIELPKKQWQRAAKGVQWFTEAKLADMIRDLEVPNTY